MADGEYGHVQLSIGELRFLLDRVADLVVPSFLIPDDSDEVPAAGADDDDLAMFAALKLRGIIDTDATSVDADLTEAISPVLIASLGLHSAARFFMDVKAWSPQASIRSWVSVIGTLCAGFRVTSDRHATTDGVTSSRVDVSLLPLSNLVEYLLEPLAADPSPVRPAQATVGLTESRSIIEALRRGDPAVATSIAHTFHREDALPLLSEMVGPMEHGFTALLFNHQGKALSSANWFRAVSGWLKIGLVARPGASIAVARALTDHGRVTVTRAGLSALRAELQALVVTVARVRHAG